MKISYNRFQAKDRRCGKVAFEVMLMKRKKFPFLTFFQAHWYLINWHKGI